MNNENKVFFINDVEINVSNDDILLAPLTELFDEARDIAQNTASDEKLPFDLEYDANQKEFLLSILKTVGADIENDDERSNILYTMMNMTQLAFIKPLDCIERVKTDKKTNPFLNDGINHSSMINNETEEIKILNATTQPIMLSIDEPSEASAVSEECSSPDNIAMEGRCYDIPNPTLPTATEIEVEEIVNGCICCPGAEQWFKFTAPKSATYTIYTTGSLDTVGTLYNSSRDLITSVDDRAECGELNFRIIHYLNANTTYYIRVTEAISNTGNYYLQVTEKTLVDSISITPSSVILEKNKTYELPMEPNTFVNIEGTEQLSNLCASTVPATADEKRVFWDCPNNDVISITTDWHNGQKYQTITALNVGTATLYAYDWKSHGKRGVCAVCVTEGWPEYPQPTIFSRALWGARNIVENRLVERTKKPEMIIFHHTADKFQSTDTSKIISEIKDTQDEHIDDRGKCDIAYHFIIDPAGGIWQGAEIDEYQRGHAEGHFNDIGVVLLGDFENRLINPFPNILNDNQKNAMRELSKWLCYKYDLPFDRVNRISPITTHKSASGGTECPGDNAEPWIENDLQDYITNWHP